MNLYLNPTVKSQTVDLSVRIYDYALQNLGRKNETEAWKTFCSIPDMEYPSSELVMRIFMPWYLYSWENKQKKILGYEYLNDHYDELSETERLFISSALINQFSFYKVIEAEAGRYLILKNLITREEVIVFENSASKELRVGDIIFAKLASVYDLNFIVGLSTVIISERFEKRIKSFTRSKFRENELSRIDLFFEMAGEILEVA